jgi:hypothetical protein
MAENFAYRRAAAEEGLRRGDPAEARRRVRLQEPMEVPTIEKVVINMGVGEATNDTKKVAVRRSGSRAHRRPEAGDHQGPQGDRDLQGPREHADRLQGDAAQDAHVRVHRPTGDHRAAARPRLPRPERRSRSTVAAISRSGSRSTSSSPRSTTTRSESSLGYGRHRLHHREDRRRGTRPAARLQLPVPAVRARLLNAETRRDPWRRRVRSRRTTAASGW